jgi:shikimate 5-dehydrogenase
MKDLLVLLVHLLTTIAKLLGPGGARAVAANSLLMKQQLLVVNRSRRRAPNLSALDRYSTGCGDYQTINPLEILRYAQEAKVSTAVFIWQQRKTSP